MGDRGVSVVDRVVYVPGAELVLEVQAWINPCGKLDRGVCSSPSLTFRTPDPLGACAVPPWREAGDGGRRGGGRERHPEGCPDVRCREERPSWPGGVYRNHRNSKHVWYAPMLE